MLLSMLMAFINGDDSRSSSEDSMSGDVIEEESVESSRATTSAAESGLVEKKNKRRHNKSRSIMWDHFTLQKCGKKVKCNHCGEKKAWHKSTSTHIAHLRLKHGSTVNVDKVKAGSIDNHFDKKKKSVKKVSKERAKQITDAIMRVISLDLRPFNLVTGRGFLHLLNVLEPGYKVPHRTTFSRQCLPNHYHIVKTFVAAYLKTVSHMSIAYDLWTDDFKKLSYITVICHFVDSDWKMRSFVLGTRR